MAKRYLVDVNEAERLTGLKQQTIYKLARQGRLPSFRVLNRTLRFNRRDVLSLVSENRSATFDAQTGAVE